MRIFVLSLFFAMPLSAQTLDERYQAIGTFDGEQAGSALALTSVLDLEKDRSMIKRRDSGGFTTISISARTISDEGEPTSPSVSFTIGPIGSGTPGARSDIFYSDASGYYVADVDNGNRATLDAFQLDDKAVSFSVSADLIPIKRGDDGFIVDDARQTLAFSGAYSGTFPSED